MAKLVVENCAGPYKITVIDVSANGQTVARQSGVDIYNGQTSEPIELPPGDYTVTVTLQDKAGKTRKVQKDISIREDGIVTVTQQDMEGETRKVQKDISIDENGTVTVPIHTHDLDPESKIPVPPNLVS